jgi:hypothetical protein
MIIHYSGQFSEKDFARVYRQAVPHRPLFWGIYILVVVGLGFQIAIWYGTVRSILFLVGFGLFFLVLWLVSPSLGAQRAYRINPELQHPISGTVSETGITVQTAQGLSERQWGFYQSAFIFSDIVLVFKDKNRSSAFLRSQFSTEFDWQTFITIVKLNVHKHITKKPSAWPVVYPKTAWIILYSYLILLAAIYLIFRFLL